MRMIKIYRTPLFEDDERELHPGRGDENENIFHQYLNETGIGRNTMLPWWYRDNKIKRTGKEPSDDEVMMDNMSSNSFVDTPFNEETGFSKMIEPMDVAWSVLKATLPIKPMTRDGTIRQPPGDVESKRFKVSPGIARSLRSKNMDDFQVRYNDNLTDETDVMNQHGGRDYEADSEYPDYGPNLQEHNTQIKPFLSGNPSIDRTGTPEEIAERAMLRAQGHDFLEEQGA